MKRFLALILILFITSVTSAFAFGDDYDKKPVTLPKGTFLKAVMQREVSTATNKIGDDVRMIASMPTFASDGIVIPEKSVYVGKIIEINQPIEGCNGSLRVRIDKIIFPSGDEMAIDGMLWSSNNNLFGGELTPPAYYSKIPHFTFGWKGGCLAFQNSGIYQVGKPTVIKAGAEMIIILEQDTDFHLYEL